MGEPLRLERELEHLFSEQDASTATPKLVLSGIPKKGGLPQINLMLSGGNYLGLIRQPLPDTFRLHVNGKVEMVDTTAPPAAYDQAARKKWKVRELTASGVASNATGVNSITASVDKVKTDGTFALESAYATTGKLRALDFVVRAKAKKTDTLSVKCRVELLDLQGLLARVVPLETKTTLSKLEFVVALRKVFQGGPSDSLAPFFNMVLYRFRNTAVAATGIDASWLRLYAPFYFEGEQIDAGHVLTGIEGSPVADPDKGKSLKLQLATWSPELIVTWEGDLGSALYAYAKDYLEDVNGRWTGDPLDVGTYVRRLASRADLIGDLDGINLGAAYDVNKTVSENFKAYYGTGSRKRFASFIANTRANDGSTPLAVSSKKQLTTKAREFVANQVSRFCKGKLITDPALDPKTDKASWDTVSAVLEPTSAEMDLVVDAFSAFLENGLTLEARNP